MNTHTRASHLRLMAFDVDGVLTDGSLIYGPNGEEQKVFNTLDGHGLKMLQQAGIIVAIISGRGCAALERRTTDLGILHLFQNVRDKRGMMVELLLQQGLTAEASGYMGDDVVDLPILRMCGFSAAPADAHPFLRHHVNYICHRSGGRGAVREVCDFILSAQGKLDSLHAEYLE